MTLTPSRNMTNRHPGMARRIKAARALAGMDQAALGEYLGVSHQAISSWEHGRTEPSASYFLKLIALSGTSLEFFNEGLKEDAALDEARAALVRPEGFEPPTFCFGVSAPETLFVFLALVARSAGLLST